MVRFLFDANRNMPLEGDTRFKELKKSYGSGIELRGKIGIIGLAVSVESYQNSFRSRDGSYCS